jgi:hypothetical protein
VELTDSGSSIEYFTVTNKSNREAELSGFLLNIMDPETGGVCAGSRGVRINEGVSLTVGNKASIGRSTEIVDADWKEVGGIFVNDESFMVEAKDQVRLLDRDGAIVDAISV